MDTFAVDSFFDVILNVGIAPNAGGPPIATELVEMELTNGPFGFESMQLYNRGLDRCGEAIREWSLCEAAGAIQQQEAYYGELQKMKAECDLEM